MIMAFGVDDDIGKSLFAFSKLETEKILSGKYNTGKIHVPKQFFCTFAN